MSRPSNASLILLATISFYALSSTRAADDSKPAEPGHLVAILDYDEAFKNSHRYKAELEKLKAGTTQADNDLKTRYDTLHKMEEELKALQPGSPEYNKRQEAATLMKHELQARIQIERAMYEQKRVQLEVTVMREIDDVTKQICIKNNIAQVTNVSTRTPQLTDLESTERHRQRAVVYFNSGLNLTSLVLNKMNNDYADETKIPVDQRPTNGATRPGPSIKPSEPTKK